MQTPRADQSPVEFDVAKAIENTTFDLSEIDGSIRESGLSLEFELTQNIQRKLAADAMVICSLAFEAHTDEEFAGAVGHLSPVQTPDEAAFLFGFIQHVQSALIDGVGAFLDEEGSMKEDFLRRIRLSRQLCGFVQ